MKKLKRHLPNWKKPWGITNTLNRCLLKWFSYVLLLFFSIIYHVATAQEIQQRVPTQTRILFLLDGSGSMLGKWENFTRIQVAKEILGNLVDSLKVNNQLELALRVYGHQYHRRYQNCTDTKLEVPFAKNNHQAIIQRLNSINPQGNTPLAYSLEQAARDFPEDDRYRNILIIITDGLESCDGDPCAVSLALQRRGIFLKPLVIGLGLTNNYSDNFDCIGTYYDGSNIYGFRKALNEALRRTLGKATVTVELLDHQGRPAVSDINVTFLNSFTRQAAYEFVHYRNKYGKPDSVQVDPVLSYDVVVNTIPPVVKTGVEIIGGQHNIISISTPQGTLTTNMPSYTEYKNGITVLVRKAGTSQVIHTFSLPEKAELLAGTYDLEYLTTPRTNKNNVIVPPLSGVTISIPAPGVLNLDTSVPGIGSIYELNDTGQQRWVANIDKKNTRQSLALQPGSYKIVFRATNAAGSKYTKIKDFRIRSDQAVNLNLFR